MRITIDTDAQTLRADGPPQSRELPLYSPEAFEIVSREWVRIGWSLRYFFTFTWMGLPFLQLPEDMLRLQEVLFVLRPDIIVETGVCFGGSLLFYGNVLAALGTGRVIGVERKFAPETRDKLLGSLLGDRIILVEGDSAAPDTVDKIRAHIAPADKVMVILDSDHSKRHVAAEMNAYSPLITPGSCLLVADAVMRDLADVPGGQADWTLDSPGPAIEEFLENHPEFVQETPAWLFNESPLKSNITYWPGGWLWRKPNGHQPEVIIEA